MKNLRNILFPAHFKTTNDIAEMLNRSKGEAYPTSIPLIIAGVMGSGHYDAIRDFMHTSVRQMTSLDGRPMKAWMLGRMIQADMAMENDVTETVAELKTLLKTLAKEREFADSFETWAWGYLAYADYEYAKEPMMHNAQALRASDSDKLWAWVMAVQAAANAKDKDIYDCCLAEIKNITKKSTVAEALTVGLTRNEASKNNDFPAWALAIVYSAAQMMGDTDENPGLMDKIEPTLKQSINEAKQIVAARSEENPEFAYKVLAEQRLAEVISCLASERQKEALANKAGVYVPK